MSKKSRKRKERRNIDRSSSDVLSIQKQTMKQAFLDYLGGAITFFVVALVAFVVGILTEDAAHSNELFLALHPLFLVLPCFALFIFFVDL